MLSVLRDLLLSLLIALALLGLQSRNLKKRKLVSAGQLIESQNSSPAPESRA